MNDVFVNSAETASSHAGNTALRIVTAGGEGHLGRILTRYRSGMGHRLTTFTRNPHRVAASSDAPGQRTAIHWDGRNLGDGVEKLDGTDVLINLSGRSVDCRYHLRNRQELLQSRVQSTLVRLRLVRMGLGGAWGSGKQWMSWIHELDFCRAVEFLMERREIRGVVNVAAPVPPLAILETKTAIRDRSTLRVDAPAFQQKLGLSTEEERSQLEHPLRGGKSKTHPRSCSQFR
jgi:NAD dependent epimerase/dehydratase family enzyme